MRCNVAAIVTLLEKVEPDSSSCNASCNKNVAFIYFMVARHVTLQLRLRLVSKQKCEIINSCETSCTVHVTTPQDVGYSGISSNEINAVNVSHTLASCTSRIQSHFATFDSITRKPKNRKVIKLNKCFRITCFKALSHGAIFLATCNAILLLRGVNS